MKYSVLVTCLFLSVTTVKAEEVSFMISYISNRCDLVKTEWKCERNPPDPKEYKVKIETTPEGHQVTYFDIGIDRDEFHGLAQIFVAKFPNYYRIGVYQSLWTGSDSTPRNPNFNESLSIIDTPNMESLNTVKTSCSGIDDAPRTYFWSTKLTVAAKGWKGWNGERSKVADSFSIEDLMPLRAMARGLIQF